MDSTLADRLWSADRDRAEACLRHPFVTGLADGALPARRFGGYLAQDTFFLRAFADACWRVEGRCDDAAGRALLAELAQRIEGELGSHRAQAASLGIDLARATPSEATLAYTDFLTATAATRPEACAAAAMLPRLRLHAWLGQALEPRLVPASPWARWARAYADPGYDGSWRRLAPRLERGGVEPLELARLHRRAMTLELASYAAAWGGDAPGQPPLALTIAGSDPSGGAGIQADLKTFQRAGVYGQAVITLLTAQNTRGVQGVFVERADVVRAQLESVLGDLGAAAAKTGALGTAEVVGAVAEALRARPVGALVVDPVLVSKHGHDLADPTVVRALRGMLLPLARVVTPNRFEAERLTGVVVDGVEAAERAARVMLADGARAAVVKDVPGLSGDLCVDGTGVQVFAGPRVDTPHRHGTGCTFSAAITAHLAHGRSLAEAVDRARDTLLRALASAPGFGAVGPVNHWA